MDYAALREGLRHPHQRIDVIKIAAGATVGRTTSLWAIAPNAGAAPSTAEVPTRATDGALGQRNSANVQRLVAAHLASASNPQRNATWILADRLSHQGGLSGAATGPQTTNLPTAALTRYTDGVGVLVSLDIYAAIGSTVRDVEVSYTNQAGASGRTTEATQIGGTGFNAVSRSILLPLQQGDYGVRSVESVTLSASTGTAGNIGVTLFRPLIVIPAPLSIPIHGGGMLGGSLLIPEVKPDACLYWLAIPASNSTGVLSATIYIAED